MSMPEGLNFWKYSRNSKAKGKALALPVLHFFQPSQAKALGHPGG